MPRSGDVLHIGKAASVQFIVHPINLRVIRVHDWPTYDGWVWLDGYQLNNSGDAVERRNVFVQIAGLRAVATTPDPRTRNGERPARAARNTGPAVPRPRTSPETTITGRTR